MFDSSFFVSSINLPGNIEKGIYQLPLVLLSYIVASFASYTALTLAQQLVGTQNNKERRFFLLGGSFAMGAGIWSMHFIGMLSYKMDMVVTYDPLLTLLSMLIAITVAYGALYTVARDRLTLGQVSVGAFILGFGICAMHYTGMAAMKMDAALRYIPSLVLLSFLVSIIASAAALWMAFTLARSNSKYRYLFQIGASLIMGAAICGMHYTGMAAAVFVPYADCRFNPHQNFDALAISIAIITAIILSLAMIVGIYRKGKAEHQLQISENKLRTLIDNAIDAVISMDQNGNITEWNKQAEAIFGWTYKNALGKDFGKMIILTDKPDEGHNEVKGFLGDSAGSLLNKRVEVTAIDSRGRQFPMELSITTQEIRKTSYFTAFARDISERKQSEEALKEANRKKDDFLANMSHELRTPMNAVVGLANLLMMSEPLTLKQKKFVDTLKASADSLLVLINNLLDFAKLEQHGVEVEMIEFDLNEVIQKVVAITGVKTREKNISFVVEVPEFHNNYIGDPLNLHQILINLLSNATKFTEKGKIELNIKINEGQNNTALLVMKVSDSGIGIPPEKIKSIFEKFIQVDSSITRKYGGTGLGLSISKTLIEQMGGTIRVESELNKGSIFTVELPLKIGHRLLVNKAPSGVIPYNGNSKKILLVEDNQPNILVAGNMLEHLGFQYDVATDGYEAVTKYQSDFYDIILMDIQMPKMGGFQATNIIRAYEKEKGLKPAIIIAITAHVQDKDKNECLKAGMDDFITKPFEPEKLLAVIKRFIDG